MKAMLTEDRFEDGRDCERKTDKRDKNTTLSTKEADTEKEKKTEEAITAELLHSFNRLVCFCFLH
jgi:hypothetical protein